MKEKPLVLLTIPVRNRAWCLPKLLTSILKQDYPLNRIKIMFLVNDCTDHTETVIEKFQDKYALTFKSIAVWVEEFGAKGDELKDHFWTNEGFKRIGIIRNRCLNNWDKEDYLLMVDSDLKLHPHVITRLVETKKDIICENSWATWNNQLSEPLPHITDDLSPLFPKQTGWITTDPLIEKLKKPGLYKLTPNKKLRVGTCILLSKAVQKKKIDFTPLADNWDEQLSFCASAQKAGFDIWMDTTCENISLEQYFVHDIWTKISHDLYTQAVEIIGEVPAEVIDVGCGVGYGTRILQEAGYNAHGIDLNPNSIILAKENCGVRVKQMDFFKSNLGGDVLISFEMIEHVHFIRDYLEQIQAWMVPAVVGGKKRMFIISTPNSDLFHQQPNWHIHRFTQPVFEEIMKEMFPNVKFKHLHAMGKSRPTNFVAYAVNE